MECGQTAEQWSICLFHGNVTRREETYPKASFVPCNSLVKTTFDRVIFKGEKGILHQPVRDGLITIPPTAMNS